VIERLTVRGWHKWYKLLGGLGLLMLLSSGIVLWTGYRRWWYRQTHQQRALEIDNVTYTVQEVLEGIRRFVPSEILPAQQLTPSQLLQQYLEDFLLIQLVRREFTRNRQRMQTGIFQEHVLLRALPSDPILKQEAQALIAMNYAFYLENPEAMEISQADIERYYQTHQHEFQRGERVILSQLAFESAEEATQAYHQIRAMPELFDQYTHLNLQGSLSQRDGLLPGFIGVMETQDLPRELRKIMQSTPVGQCTPPIKIGETYVLFKILDRRPAGIAPLEEVREEIRLKLLETRIHQKVQAWIMGMIRRHRIIIYWQNLGIDPESVRRRWIPGRVFRQFRGS